MAALDVYSTDAHLGFRDRELFEYNDVSYRVDHRSAREDVENELLSRGFDDGLDNIADDSAVATVTLTFTAEAGGGGVTVPEGFEVYSAEDRTKVTFVTDEELILADGESADVDATCEEFGEPGNVAEEVLVYFDALAGLESVTNADVATGGVNHQLTKVCTLGALITIYADLSRNKGDSYDHKREMYEKMYHTALKLLMARGLTLDSTDPDLIAPGQTRAFPRLRLTRS
jgi:hypothetical protein